MDEWLVSIVTPCYNSATSISGSINSVLAQTYTNLEMIVVDDGSHDRSSDMVRTYTEMDSRIHLITFDRNRGPAAARNAAIEEARGRFIAFLDSDDLWAPNKLEIQVAAMADAQYPLSCTGYTMQRENGNSKVIIPAPIITRSELLVWNDIGCLTAMIDMEVTRQKIYMRDIRMRQDYLLWLDVLANNRVALGISDVLATLHVGSNSLTGNKFKAAGFQWKAYRDELRLGLPKSTYFFMRYAIHGALKHWF